MKKLLSITLTAIAFGLVMPIAHADDVAIALSSYTDFSDGSWSMGFAFSPTVNIDVTSLGSYFPAGATDEHGVSLWNSSGDLIDTVTVTGDDSATGGFDFTALTPIELLAGDTYVIGTTTTGDDYAIFPDFTVGPDLNYIGYQEAVCSGVIPCYPASEYYGVLGDFGPNFTYAQATATPEPSTFLMLGSGLVGLAGMVRRRFARG